MSTAPYATTSVALVAGTHRQDYTVRATHPDWDDPITLDATDLSIGWDETRSPRCTASVTVPADTIDTDLLSPLTGVRIEVDAGYITEAGASDVHPVADLGLRSRTVDRPSNTVRLECAGDEALVQDYGPGFDVIRSTTDDTGTVAVMIERFLALPWSDVPVAVVLTGSAGPTVVMDQPTSDKMNVVKDLADQIGAEVYDDGLRTWRIRPRPTLAGTPSTETVLTVGAGGTLTDTTSGLSRGDGYANYVALHYAWRPTGATDDTRIVARAYASSVFAGARGIVTYVEERQLPTTQAAANAAAAALLRRALSRGRQLRVSAVAAWWLRPGDTVTVQLPTGPPTVHLVAAVEFNAARASMDVTTRLPDDATITTGE